MAHIPFGSIIIETFDTIIIGTILFSIIKQYRKRKAEILKTLIITYIFIFLGVFSSFIGRFIVYITKVPGENTHVYTIVANIFSLVGSFFMMGFSYQLFIRRKKHILSIFALLTGFDEGVLFYNLAFYRKYEQGSYATQIYFVAATLTSLIMGAMFLIIFIYGNKAVKNEQNRVKKISIQAISTYGLFAFISLILFAVDSLISPDFEHYLITYYLGWSFIIIASIIAYVGYFQPKWFQKIMSKSKEK